MNTPKWKSQISFETIDARKLSGFFMPQIMETAKSLSDKGLKIIQSFEPVPLYAMLEKEGWIHYTEQIAPDEFHIYFIKEEQKKTEEESKEASGGRIPIVLQSATPVVYPVILRMQQSGLFQETFEVTELKVWQETEKHLSWIVSGKADISFSAIIASANLLGKENDVKLASVNVWDNFYIVTRGYEAASFADIKEHHIYMPLFKKAPPAQVTRYIMRALGEDPEAYHFVYGTPFGRPEEIAQKLIDGQIDTALIREPEVSYALHAHPDIHVAFSYSELWQRIKPGSHGLPNAGLVFKGAFLRNHPQEAKLFMREMESAIQWIETHKDEAAKLSAPAMGHSEAEIRLFLDRVHYENWFAMDVKDEISEYLGVVDDDRARLLKELAEDLFVTREELNG